MKVKFRHIALSKLTILLGAIFLFNFGYSSSLKNPSPPKKVAPEVKTFLVYDSLVKFFADKNRDSAYHFLIKLLNVAQKVNIDSLKLEAYLMAAYLIEDYEVAKKYFDTAATIAKEISDSLYGEVLQQQGRWLEDHGNYEEAIEMYTKALDYFHLPEKKAEIYNSLGLCYKKIGYYDKAIQYYQQALKAIEKSGNLKNQVFILNNIALIHRLQENYQIALEYFYKIIDITKQIDDKEFALDIQARTYLSISMVLSQMGKPVQALANVLKSKDLFKRLNSPFIIYAYRNAGLVYIDLEEYEKAIKYLDSALNSAPNNPAFLGNIYYLKAKAYLGMAEKNNDINAYKQAISYSQKALEYILKTKTTYLENKVYQILYKSYAALGEYKKAFYYALEYIRTNQILFNDEKTKIVQELEAKYQAEKKQQEIEKLRLINEKKEEQLKRQKLQKQALIAIVVLMTALAYITYVSYRRKKRDNMIIQQKNAELEQAYEEIRVQRDQLQEQKNKIEKMHQQLQDSIRYAQRIQTAALPSPEQLAELFDEYFVFFRPLNIVSGDFYWAKKVRDRYIAFTVADCTGHGVPGAFVSMLGISLLNEIVLRREILKASDVLEELRKEIKQSLKQSTNYEDSKDGMDIAFCIYDTHTHELQFAGANNPMYLIRNGELIEYKAVKNPVAVYIREKPFETHYIKLQSGDVVYLSSDGFYDQPGGPDGKKFMRKRFKQMLVKIWNLPMEEQYEVVKMTFEEWKNGYRQIDDVCVMGVRFVFDENEQKADKNNQNS